MWWVVALLIGFAAGAMTGLVGMAALCAEDIEDEGEWDE